MHRQMVVKPKQERFSHKGLRTPFAVAGLYTQSTTSFTVMQHAVICGTIHKPLCLLLLGIFTLRSAPALKILQKARSLAQAIIQMQHPLPA